MREVLSIMLTSFSVSLSTEGVAGGSDDGGVYVIGPRPGGTGIEFAIARFESLGAIGGGGNGFGLSSSVIITLLWDELINYKYKSVE